MRTQKHDLKDEIKHLEERLKFALHFSDAHEQMAIYKELDIAKSTLYNIR